MRKVFIQLANNFANEAEKKDIMTTAYKIAMCKMNDMMVFPVSTEFDLGKMTLSFIVRAEDATKAKRCLNNLTA